MKKFLKIIKNPYIITVVVLALMFIFFDDNKPRVAHQLSKEVKELHEEEARLREQVRQDSLNAANVNDLEAVERYGRETYYLRAKDEDVYIVEPSSEEPETVK